MREESSVLLSEAISEVETYLLGEGLLGVSSEEIRQKVREENYEAEDYRVRPLEERLYRILKFDSSVQSSDLSAKMNRCFMGPIFSRGRCYEDTLPTLKALQSKNFRIGIVSNTPWGSPATLWREELDRLGLQQWVDAAVFCHDVGWRKPARQIFEFTLHKLKADAEDCIFVGDNPKWDLLGPQTVGIDGILIDRRGDVLDFEGETIRNLSELLTILRP
jgi:putative hydrolase of the HAD superfamily